jgi:hypothetical protein
MLNTIDLDQNIMPAISIGDPAFSSGGDGMLFYIVLIAGIGT